MSTDKPKSKITPPNIQFVGKIEKLNKETGKMERVLRDAPEKITDGEMEIILPPSNEQKKGFYHEQAAQIIALFPDDYKIPTAKGDKN